MTAREKVLKVYGNASVTDCAGVWEIWDSEAFEGDYAHRIGHSSVSEEAAWKNAAESLPAPVVPDKVLGTCDYSMMRHAYCGNPLWKPLPFPSNYTKISYSSTVEAKETINKHVAAAKKLLEDIRESKTHTGVIPCPKDYNFYIQPYEKAIAAAIELLGQDATEEEKPADDLLNAMVRDFTEAYKTVPKSEGRRRIIEYATAVKSPASIPCFHCNEFVGQHHNNGLRCPGMSTTYTPKDNAI